MSLLTPEQTIKKLGLPNKRYLKYLVIRRLLPRITVGPRTFRHEEEDCDELLMKCKTEGIILTLNPNKKKKAA